MEPLRLLHKCSSRSAHADEESEEHTFWLLLAATLVSEKDLLADMLRNLQNLDTYPRLLQCSAPSNL